MIFFRPKNPHAPVQVLLVSPYGVNGGGMGRCMEYLAATPTNDFVFSMIESRGAGSKFLSPLFVLSAGLRMVYACRPGHRAILHANMAEGGSVLRKGLLIHLAVILRLPSVLHLHAAEIVPFYESLPPLPQRLVRGIFRQASAIIVLGTQPACWVRNALGVDPARVTIVRNGVAPPSLPRDTTRGAGFHLVFLGNLVARKGLPDLLHALAAPALRPRAWSLTVAGGGDSTPMRQCAESLGIASRVTFAGWISRDEAAALLARADALVLPSYNEALPLVVLEALSFALPVITTPVGSLPDILVDNETALLVPPGDRAALTHAAYRLLTEAGLAARIGAAGHDLFQRHLTQQGFTAGIHAVYRSITRS